MAIKRLKTNRAPCFFSVVKFLVFIITILIYQRNILVIANILQDTSLLYRYNSFVMLGAYKTLYRKEAYYESAK